MTLFRFSQRFLTRLDRMVYAICATDLALPIDHTKHLPDRSGVSAQEPSWLQSNAPNLPRSLKTHHSTEGGPVASVSLDRFAGAESVVQDLHGAFIASAPVRR